MAKKTTIKSRLKKLQGDWANSEPTRGRISLPDDNYDVRIDSAVLGESKASQRMQIDYAMTVISGEYEGKTVHKYDGLDSPENLPYVQGTLEALELEIPDDINDIGATLEDAAGLEVSITVQTKDEFTNIYFNELLEGGDEEDEEEDEDEEEEEDADEEEEEDEDEDEEEDDEDESEYDEDEINTMSKAALVKMIKEDKIDVNPKKCKTVQALRKAVISECFEK